MRKKKECSNCENKEQKTFIWKVQSPHLPGECLLTAASKSYVGRNRSQTLVGGGGTDAKRGGLKCLTLIRGGLEKITTNFPMTVEFTCHAFLLTHYIMAKRADSEIF